MSINHEDCILLIETGGKTIQTFLVMEEKQFKPFWLCLVVASLFKKILEMSLD